MVREPGGSPSHLTTQWAGIRALELVSSLGNGAVDNRSAGL